LSVLVQLQSNFFLLATVIIRMWYKQGHRWKVAGNAVAKYSTLHPLCSCVQNKVRRPVNRAMGAVPSYRKTG